MARKFLLEILLSIKKDSEYGAFAILQNGALSTVSLLKLRYSSFYWRAVGWCARRASPSYAPHDLVAVSRDQLTWILTNSNVFFFGAEEWTFWSSSSNNRMSGSVYVKYRSPDIANTYPFRLARGLLKVIIT